LKCGWARAVPAATAARMVRAIVDFMVLLL